ncbi:Nociceptin receptor [Takifugu flavidus]|uniref:Nociceptin receptor n=1 Tax=Takifugu flavidus TaxID=433684 RepID=A0A5C6MMP3_9TELE|nr:Nociceptin receptor [Takifugu flavidus]
MGRKGGVTGGNGEEQEEKGSNGEEQDRTGSPVKSRKVSVGFFSTVLQLNAFLRLKTGSDHLFVFWFLLRYTKMKTATNIYIFNLALADSLFLATLPFQGTDVFLGFWPFGNILCKAVVSIDYYNMFTSTFTLTVMSMDRYIAVCHPVKALDMRTPHKAKVRSQPMLPWRALQAAQL